MREMKDSGVEWIGEIPSDKHLMRNKYLLEYVKGKLPNSTNTDGIGFPYIGASNLDSDNEYTTFTTDEELPNAEIDDLLVLWDGARAGLCGTNKVGKVSSTIVRIRANKNVFSPFLYWYYKGFESYMYQSVNGTTIPHMNRKYIEQIGFIDWTLNEQQKIADYLDRKCSKIDEIITKQGQVIEKLKAYKLSIITESVTKGLNPNVKMKDSGVEWIGEIPVGWGVAPIRYIFRLRDEKNYLPSEQVQLLSLYTELGIFPHGEQEERGNKAVTTEGYKVVYKGDIVVNIILAWMGAIGESGYNGVTSPAYDVYKPKKNINSTYYHYLFRTKAFSSECYKYGRGIMAMRWRTYSSEFKSIKASLPPLTEQQAIADHLDKKCTEIEKAIEKKQAIIDKLTAYKKSLIYEVVTGKKEV